MVDEFDAHQLEWAGKKEGASRSRLSDLIFRAYRFRRCRPSCWAACRRLEGGEMFSSTMRRILSSFHGVEIGRYSYGSCMTPGVLPAGSRVGAYCSFASGLRVFRRNHPVGTLSQHPFFYNRQVGLLAEDRIEAITDNPLEIGNDVWIGDRVTILPGCRTIGDGAIVGAGSVLTRDVEPFAIMGGNPAKTIRHRFASNVAAQISDLQWWTRSLVEVMQAGRMLFDSVRPEDLDRFMSMQLGHGEGHPQRRENS